MKAKKFDLFIIWDFVMVMVVLANLTLIVFDLTYLWLRPYYYKKFPAILEFYDKPILGIEPHRSTEKYIKFVDTLKFLERIKDPSVHSQEFSSKLNEMKEAIQFVYTQDDVKLMNEKSLLLEKYSLVTKPGDISQDLLDTEELFLDLLSYKEGEYISAHIEKLESDLLLLSRVETEKGWKEEKEDVLSKMDYQMIHIVETNPFQASGQTENISKIKSNIKTRYDSVKTRDLDKDYRNILSKSLGGQKSFPSTALVFTWFWRNPQSSMDEKFTIFDNEIRDLMGVNYYRHIGKNGKPVNNYLVLDAPFLAFFVCEFALSWFIAIRKKKYLAWFLYPIYHWYDVLGLLPIVEFRLFRLIRIYKIFLILKTSRIVPVGNDIISRTIKYYGNIIKEELSDMVTIQIITESQEEIKSGASLQIMTKAIEAHRDDIKRVVVRKLKESASNERLGELIEKTIAEILEKSEVGPNKFGFLPKAWKDNLAKEISSILYNAISQAVLATLDDESGVRSIENLVDYIIDELEATAQDPEVNKLNMGITVELLENVKKSVARKKWLDTKI
ncbi:MAG: hypothetical protein O9346_07460 [Leptospiraceae bacterium]|nr:hypothetical protein [Leptospiraceae bacterium]MCZ8346236.1 hypothetical protein [Leptospiraceae bacterium]